MERDKEVTLHNDKYNIDFTVYVSGYGISYKFNYLGKDHSAFAGHQIGDIDKYINDYLEKMINILDVNEKEKTKEIRHDEITEENYILLEINEKEDQFFDDIKFGNKDFEENGEVEIYDHDGLTSDYFIIRGFRKGKEHTIIEEIDLTYQPFFMHLAFEGIILGNNTLYIKNNGENSMFVSSRIGKMIIRPKEQVRYDEKNLWKEEIHLPYSYGN